ncbi:acyltransferase family protein [Rathayibacter agropyri]|uniref:acyltransferase family protein n=1 Tax=Rathayibacter agropyri TaxID=1634927 RepID=UPI001567A1C3|nr:acyltransferase [Rathayibacter agropyri]NRD10111.1 acyltransferase [Rathayibacter agropyri]
MKLLKPTGGARREWVDFAKGVAILMVVYYHTSLYLGDIGVENTLGRIKIVFELFPMPLFFLVSGLFGSRITTWSFRDLWRRRLYPLLWLYVVWSVLRMVFYLVVPLANGGLGELPATDPLNLLLLFFWPSSSYWFIYGLFLFTLGAWLLRHVDHRVQVALSAVVGTLFTTGLINTTNVGWNRIGALFVFYLVGTLYSKRIIDFVEQKGARAFLYVTPVFVLLSAVLFLFPVRWVPFLGLAAQMAAVAMGILVSRALSRLRFLSFFTICGERSLHIYLLHLYVIVVCITLLRVILPEDRTVIGGFEIPLLLVVMALAVIVSLVITRYLSKIRWIYVPPAALGGPGAKKRKPVPVPARGAGVVSDPAAVPADEPGTSPSYEQKSAGREQKAESHE